MVKNKGIEYWLDTNQHIHKALIYMGLTITVLGLKNNFPGNPFVPIAGLLLLILMIFQLLLGIKEI